MTTAVALFDWTAGGHRPIYVRRFVDALRPSACVVLALPDETLAAIGDLDVQALPLGDPRPAFTGWRQRRAVLAEEVDHLSRVASHVDHTVHLFADHALFHLANSKSLPGPVSLLLYYPRAHYPAVYGTPLPPADRMVAIAKEWAVRRWRARPDAHTVFTLDEALAALWSHESGARAAWLPEPPVAPLREDVRTRREGCILYGALAHRKGIDAVARALALERTSLKLVLAGTVDPPDYLPELERHVEVMRRAGVDVALRGRPHSELEGLQCLASARCALLPYRRHPGMSRVLVEACSVGTPVIADSFGLVGHLVREHGLGVALDTSDPRALRDAIMLMTEDSRADSYTASLSRFAGRFTPERFRSALLSGLGLAPRQAGDSIDAVTERSR